MKTSNKKMNIFIGIISVIAILMYGYLIRNFTIESWRLLIFWSVITIIVESLPITLPNLQSAISVGSAINLAALITGGPLVGTTSAIIGMLLRVIYMPEKGYLHLFNMEFIILIYNLSQITIGNSIMGLVYIYTGGIVGGFSPIQTILILFIGIIINSIIMSIVMSFVSNCKITYFWINNIKGMIGITFAAGILGIIIALAFISFGYMAVILFLAPLLLTRYSFKLYLETKELYISTIEALNTAMEAKDPYTFGHSSRVQEYAVSLGNSEGLSYDKVELIKDAAILHDIGKIGISDIILNKETKLTYDEFEEIKKHPQIGAEIISKVKFLEEISEIIKYHHERYDGKGYPEGLRADEIPIESSILAI